MKFNFESWQEFLDWNVKRENHIKDLEQHNYDLQMENRNLAYKYEEAGEDARRLRAELHELKNATAENSDE